MGILNRKRKIKRMKKKETKRRFLVGGCSFVCWPVFPVYRAFTVEFVKSPWVLFIGGMDVPFCNTWLN
jgi:hypothetical protein